MKKKPNPSGRLWTRRETLRAAAAAGAATTLELQAARGMEVFADRVERDARLLRLAAALEKAHPWHDRRAAPDGGDGVRGRITPDSP